MLPFIVKHLMMNDSQISLPLFDAARQPSGPMVNAKPHIKGSSSSAFIDVVRNFNEFGRSTKEEVHEGIPYFVNEFWTSRQRQAHSVHEISYRACFKPQLPRFFIEHLTNLGDWVYDPFMGRGTTPLEAAILGRRPAGNDINPLSTFLTRPRLRQTTLARIASSLDAVAWDCGEIENSDLLEFFSAKTLRHITALRKWILENTSENELPSAEIDWIRMVAMNRLTGHSSGFFSVYTLPPNQAVSVAAQRKINAKRSQVPPDRDVKAIILKKTRTMLSDGQIAPPADILLSTAPSSATPSIPTGSIKLVVTSPPFLDIVQYAEDNWLRCWFAGIDVAQVQMAHHRNVVAWQRMIRETLKELARVVQPGGHVAFEVGEVRNGTILLERLVWDAADGLPFDRLFVMVNSQIFTKTANCWGVSNNAVGTNTNRIVVLRRSVNLG